MTEPVVRIEALCVGAVAPLLIASDQAQHPPSTVVSGIRKSGVSTLQSPQPVSVGPMGLAGDEQADLTVHGGLDQAVYAYPQEHYAFWQTVRQQARIPLAERPLAPGSLGENLLISGLLEADAYIGDCLHADEGGVVLRIESPRKPCFKFNAAMGFNWAVKMMVQSGYSGFYLSVVHPGILSAGQKLHISPGDRSMSIAQRFQLAYKFKQAGSPPPGLHVVKNN